MRPAFGLRAAVAAALSGFAGMAGAQVEPEWQVSGSNTARAERYGSSGDRTQSPYQLGLGEMGFDELNLAARLQDSPYSFWRFLASGVVNGSPYRSPYDGIVPERINLTREDGEAPLNPYRAEAGDFFAFTSLRTQQRSLKGVSVEVQPASANPAVRHSFIAFGGAFQPSWRDASWQSDNSVGASYLFEHLQAGRVSVNVLRNERGANPAFGALKRDQLVASVAGDTTLDAGGWKVRFEGEAAGIKGDHEFGATPTEAVDRSDYGLFAQVTGFDARWNWRVRGERYGKDYRPFGAVVPADRRSAGHLSYLLPGGLVLRGRIQDYRDQLESAVPQDTTVYGINFSGPIPGLGLTGTLDAFVQDLERTDRSLDTRFTHVGLSLSKAFANGLVGQFSALRQENENRLDASLDSRTTQAQASVIVPFAFGTWRGSVAPGILYRNVSGAFATRDWQPTLMLSAFGGAHRLTLNAGRLDQDPRSSLAADVATVNFALDYRYRVGRHEFGADWTVFDRKPAPGQSTNAYRLGLFWTMYFDSANVPTAARAPASIVATSALTAAGVTRSPDLLARLAPGADLEASVKALAEGGIAGGVRQPGAVVYETRLLGEIEQRQRLVLVHSGETLERSALIVSLADSGAGDDAGRIYERVRRALLDRFGSPTYTFDEGAFGPAFANELAAGRVIRITEWVTSSGGIVRLGIPRRLDGLARIEVHHARRFPSPRDTAWGLDTIR